MDDRYSGNNWTPESGLFNPESQQKVSAFNKQFRNFSLKQGFVVNCYEVDDESNVAKNGPEYDVAAVEQNENGAQTLLTYRNVVPMQAFGGIADYFLFKQRKRDKNEDDDPIVQKGDIVLLLCTDGNPDKAIIVGSIGHGARARKLTKEDGNALVWEYNGMNFEVFDDGSSTLTYRSKTDIDGIQEGEGGGSQFKFEKDGSIELHDGDGGVRDKEGLMEDPKTDDVEKFRLDKTEMTATLNARKDITIKSSKGKIVGDAKDNIELKTAADYMLEATGSAKMTAKDFTGTYKGPYKVDAMEAKYTVKTKFEVKASAQIKMQANLMDLISPLVNVGGPGGKPAVIADTVFYGVGFLGWPTYSKAIGPFSTAVFIKP